MTPRHLAGLISLGIFAFSAIWIWLANSSPERTGSSSEFDAAALDTQTPRIVRDSISRQVLTATGAEEGQYVIQSGDVIQLTVWDEPSLSAVLTIRQDGLFSSLLVENLPAAGKTPEQLARELERVYSVYLRRPRVNISVPAALADGVDSAQSRPTLAELNEESLTAERLGEGRAQREAAFLSSGLATCDPVVLWDELELIREQRGRNVQARGFESDPVNIALSERLSQAFENYTECSRSIREGTGSWLYER